MAAIHCQSLTRTYGSRRGIDAVDLSVAEGSLFGFLGPNGAGKTTTIRVLLGFLRPTSGAATIFGADCWRNSRRIKHEVGAIPGDLRLYPWLNGREALRLFGSIRRRDLSVRGRELAETFGLDLSVRVRQMSRGMRQKLGLILALAPNPRVLILDEPSTALDPLMQEVLRGQLRAMAAAGSTVFFSSHTLAEVEALCDSVAIVRDGRIVVCEPLEHLRKRAGHEVVIRFRGGVPANDLPVTYTGATRENGSLRGVWQGSTPDLIAWLHTQPVEDVSITPPSLEQLFRGFYEQPGRSAEPEAAQ